MENLETCKIAILAKSNKRMQNNAYGSCVVGITEGGQWIRLVSSEDGDSIPQNEAALIPIGHVIEADIIPVPLSHQIENALLIGYRVSSDSIRPYIENAYFFDEEGIFGNNKRMLSDGEAEQVVGSLRLIEVFNLNTYRNKGEKCKAEFTYQGVEYTDIAMTAPDWYAAEGKKRSVGNALIVVSIPEDPPYMKFVAAIYKLNSL